MTNNAFVDLCKHGTAIEIRNALLKGANPNARNEFGTPALASARNPEVVSLLLKAGADVNAKKKDDGMTVLMSAILYKQPSELISLLLKAGADVNAKTTKYVQTALMFAVRTNTPEVVSLLLKAGADVNAKGENGETALIKAAAMDEVNPEVISLLLKAGADVNAKIEAGYFRDRTALMANVDKRYTGENNTEVVSILLNAGADVNARYTINGKTVLMLAVIQNQSHEIISLLLKAGADVNAKDNEGKTPLDRAWYVHNEATIKMLEEAIGRNSVLEEAMVGNSPETLYQLGVKYATGDDVKADEKKGVELLRKAAEQGHEKAKDALKLFE